MHIFMLISLIRVHIDYWKFYLAKLFERGHVPPVSPGSYAHVTECKTWKSALVKDTFLKWLVSCHPVTILKMVHVYHAYDKDIWKYQGVFVKHWLCPRRQQSPKSYF